MKLLASLSRVLSRHRLKRMVWPGNQEDLVKTEPSAGQPGNPTYSPIDQTLLKFYRAMDLAG